MRKRLFYGFATILLALCVVLVVWEGSVRLSWLPTNPGQTFIFWAISILTFVLTVTLGWILFRTGVKLYMERQSRREGSRIRTKLVFGALILISAPVFCLVMWSYAVLNYNLTRWFTDPAQKQVDFFAHVSDMFQREMRDETTAQAGLLAAQPETIRLLRDGVKTPGVLEEFCKLRDLNSAAIYGPAGSAPVDSWERPDSRESVKADYAVRDGDKLLGSVELVAPIPLDIGTESGTSRTGSRLAATGFAQQRREALLHHAGGADHAVRAVRGHLDRAVPGQADQRARSPALLEGAEPGAQGQSEISRGGEGRRRTGHRWCAASTR